MAEYYYRNKQYPAAIRYYEEALEDCRINAGAKTETDEMFYEILNNLGATYY